LGEECHYDYENDGVDDSEHQHCTTCGSWCKSSLMAVEPKPLFHSEVMGQQVRSFALPEHVAAIGRGKPHGQGLRTRAKERRYAAVTTPKPLSFYLWGVI
jgi:hypothetical protein